VLVTDLELRSGDVLAVSSHSTLMRLLSVGLMFRYRDTWRWNHVAIVHHRDSTGTLWAIEAAPGGVGWRNVATIPDFIHNADQPKTDEQRAEICAAALGMLQMSYDWAAIAREAFETLDRDARVSWNMEWDGPRPPTHVICSSLASYLYWKVKLPGPHSWLSTPPDWARFTRVRGWELRPQTVSYHSETRRLN
jgi:hypothetical protein